MTQLNSQCSEAFGIFKVLVRTGQLLSDDLKYQIILLECFVKQYQEQIRSLDVITSRSAMEFENLLTQVQRYGRHKPY